MCNIPENMRRILNIQDSIKNKIEQKTNSQIAKSPKSKFGQLMTFYLQKSSSSYLIESPLSPKNDIHLYMDSVRER